MDSILFSSGILPLQTLFVFLSFARQQSFQYRLLFNFFSFFFYADGMSQCESTNCTRRRIALEPGIGFVGSAGQTDTEAPDTRNKS